MGTTAFWEVRLNDPTYASILTLWLASTYGFMLFLSIATSSKGDIVKLKKDQLRDLLVPDPKRIDRKQWHSMLVGVAHEPLGVYRDQFEKAARGTGVRFSLDGFVAAQLSLKPLQRPHYELLASDPIISKKRL